MSTKSTRGFTLVELIVVITILVILGTIAFMNMGSFSASARDSQRTSDLNQINSQIMTIQAKQGLTYSNMLSGVTANQILPAPSIGGTGTVLNTSYFAGDINYTVLGIDAAKFKDPTKAVAYKAGATTAAGTAYELAASLEETNQALVMGVYRPRAAFTAPLATSVAINGTTGTVAAADIGKFRVGDTVTVTGGTPATNTIKAISADGLTLTLGTTNTVAAATALALAKEADGLIADYGTDKTKVVTNKGANLPYAIQ